MKGTETSNIEYPTPNIEVICRKAGENVDRKK
jgi:hypothetical protein